MKAQDISGIKVRVLGVHHHQWMPGNRFYHDPFEYREEHFSYQLWLVQSGCIEVDMTGTIWNIHAGSMCLFPVNLERVVKTAESSSWLSIGLRITVFNKFTLFQNVPLPIQWQPDTAEINLLDNWMSLIIANKKYPESHKQLMINGMAQTILGLCWPHLSSAPLASSIHQALPVWLGKVLEQMAINPSLGIAELAQNAGFSQAQFRRLFHQHVGTAPRDYLLMQRMEMARHYLEQTTLSPSEIAIKIGLKDVPHFSRLFKSTFGVTPFAYRASISDHATRQQQ